MAANEKLVQLLSGSGSPQVEMIIGQAQWGTYTLDLWDRSGTQKTPIGTGLNVDQVPDVFVINQPPGNLNGALLSWEVKIAAFSSGPGQLYSVTVKITQGGQLCAGGLIQDSGPLDSVKHLFDFIRFITT